MRDNKHIGSNFEDFLVEEGVLEKINLSKDQIESFLINHMHIHQVSLGNNTVSPEGSGTLTEFDVIIENKKFTIYGIMTAAHVIFQIGQALRVDKITNQQFIILSKNINNQPKGCFSSFYFFYILANKNQFGTDSDKIIDPDLGFICLGINKKPSHEIFQSSEFYCLDEQITNFDNQQSTISGFHRGACTNDEIIDNTLTNVGPYVGGGEKRAEDPKTKINYWKIPNPKEWRLVGASGSAFWRLQYKEDVIRVSFGGIMVRLSKNFKFFHATSTRYIYANFLPSLKLQCINFIKENLHLLKI